MKWPNQGGWPGNKCVHNAVLTGAELCYPRFWQIKRRGELRTGSEVFSNNSASSRSSLSCFCSNEKSCGARRFPADSPHCHWRNAGFAVKGEVEIVNITQDGPAETPVCCASSPGVRGCCSSRRQSLTGVRLALIHMTELAKRLTFSAVKVVRKPRISVSRACNRLLKSYRCWRADNELADTRDNRTPAAHHVVAPAIRRTGFMVENCSGKSLCAAQLFNAVPVSGWGSSACQTASAPAPGQFQRVFNVINARNIARYGGINTITTSGLMCSAEVCAPRSQLLLPHCQRHTA